MTKLNDKEFFYYANVPHLEKGEWIVLINHFRPGINNYAISSLGVIHIEFDTFTNLCIDWDVKLEEFLQKIRHMNKDQASTVILTAECYWKSLTPQIYLERLVKYGEIQKENLVLKSIATTHTDSAPIGM